MKHGYFIKVPVASRVDEDEGGAAFEEFIFSFRARRLTGRWFEYAKKLPFFERAKKTTLLKQAMMEADQ